MGLRFRKSITICKGVKLNISKSGASVSLGGKGHSINLSGKGARATVGIPGTGLSYSKSISTKKVKNMIGAYNYQLELDEKGKVHILSKKGEPITDASVLRQIKNSDSYKEQVNELLEQRIKEQEQIFEESQNEREQFLHLHQFSPVVRTSNQYKNPFQSDEEISEAIEQWISNIVLPVQIGIDFEYDENQKILFLDIDLPEIEDLPDSYYEWNQNQLKSKKKTKTVLQEEYACVIFGLILYIASNAFDLSPYIEKILMAGYTQRRDSKGNLNGDYIFSMKWNRNQFEGKDISQVNAIDFCMNTENRCLLSKTYQFKTIEPY